MAAELKPESDLESFCRACLIHYDEPNELVQYTEKTRRQFVYATGLQVKRNDTFQLCKECYVNIRMTCKFKKQCRTSDKRYKNYLALKEAGETADFRSFLKKTDDTFRFPFMNGYSTPMHQKNKDDDNESTTTSIRNFMTDILKAEEIPDTEVNIIRETIEEEADILDDSLDSQWLQDDVSIDTDFQLDFSFSPFATPRSVANERGSSTKKDDTHHVYAPISFSPFATPRSVANDHCYSTKKDDTQHVYAPISFSPFTTPRPAAKEDSYSPNTQHKQHVYVTSKKFVNVQGKDQGKSEALIPDSIDKNLEKALRNDAQEFALDDLLVSPAPGTPLVSTPTINDILFGKNINCDGDIQSSALPKVGQCIDPFNDVRGDDDIELFKDARMNFYGSANVAESNEMDISQTFEIDIKVEEVKADTVDTNKQEVPVPFNEEMKIEGEPVPVSKDTPLVFRPTVDPNLRPSKDKFQPSVELVYEKSENKNKENEIATENSSNVGEHAPKSKFYCDICKFDTENYTNTVLHYRAVHKVALKSKLKEIAHVCEVCGKSFRHYGNYYHHLKKHENPERGTFICDICNRKFTARSKILLHMRAHMTKQIGTKKKPLDRTKKEYICTICGARSSDSSNLKVHIRRHNKNYTVFCKECNKGFVRNQDLENHMRKHTAEKPFACAECDKRFNRRDTLTTHMRAKHTGEKPFECEFCHAKFARGNQLTIHVRTSRTCKKIREDDVQDISKAFECEFCHATFKYPCHLSLHVLKSKKCMRVRCGIPERPKRQHRKNKKGNKGRDNSRETILGGMLSK